MKRVSIIMLGLFILLMAVDIGAQISMSDISNRQLSFTENQGQFGDKTLFKAEAGGATFYFCSDEVAYLFERDTDELIDDRSALDNDPPNMTARKSQPRYKQEAMLVKAQFIGANPNPEIIGADRLSHNNNYFLGNDRSKWQTDVPNYSSIAYKDIYPGINLKYYGDGRSMKYDFIISSGADISRIRIRYEGVDELSITPAGDLQASTQFGPVYEKVPYIYQEISGKQHEVIGRYELFEPGVFGFAVDDGYDPAYPLVIDPELVYSTFIGSPGANTVNDIDVDSEGNMYITGWTQGGSYPLVNPYENEFFDGSSIIVSKISSSGDSLIYSSMIGGSANEAGYAIAVDQDGFAYFTGHTFSADFPLENAIDETVQSDEAFVIKLSPEGNSLVYSTYLGGSANDTGNDIIADYSGNAIVVGETRSEDFPTFNPLYGDNSSDDGFVTKLNSDGSAFIFSTYLGGDDSDRPQGVGVDAAGNIYVAGSTQSTDFPVTDCYDNSRNDVGGWDAFITKMSPEGTILLYGSYLGGFEYDWATGVAVDQDGFAYVTGQTNSTNFPVVNPWDGTYNGDLDAFVSKFSQDGEELLYSTYIGGTNWDSFEDIAADNNGNAYVAGKTYSADFPMIDSYDSTYNGVDDVIAAKFSTVSGCLLTSTYFGGDNDEICNGVALDDNANFYLAGETHSDDLPIVEPYNDTYGGGDDSFVAKFHMGDETIESGAITGTVTDELEIGIEGVIVTIDGKDWQGESNFAGEFLFSDLCQGIYELTFFHTLYCDSILTNVIVGEGETAVVEMSLASGGFFSGAVSDGESEPIEDVEISVIGTDFNTSTNSLGEYMFTGICPGVYDAVFSKPYYQETTVIEIEIQTADTTELDVVIETASEHVTFWYGNTDLSPISAPIGEIASIDVYAQTTENADVADLQLVLAVDDLYFDCFIIEPELLLFYPLSEWDVTSLEDPVSNYPSPAGWTSLTFIGLAEIFEPYDFIWLNSETPSLVMSFRIQTVDDQDLYGQTFNCLDQGVHRFMNTPHAGDPEGGAGYPVYEFYSPVTFGENPNYPYLPGDVNMYNGAWPPIVIGGDVTYLVGYFRSGMPDAGCRLDGFWASADANGDCSVIGSDVTYLVNYFRGMQDLPRFCPDFESLWPTPDDLPGEEPLDWPGCD